MRDYKKLEVWRKSHELYMHINKKIVIKFPREERFGLTSQLLRASLAIPLNIVEGCGKSTNKDFTRFLDISLGSTNETDYCCFAAFELRYITDEEYNTVNKMINSVRGMLICFIRYLRTENVNAEPKPPIPYTLYLTP